MKILIVGGAGYIGSHVAREFLDAGHAVTVYDNLSTGTVENIFPGEEFVEGDILDYPALRGAMAKGFDALVHLAAAKAAGESMLKPEKYSLQNLNGTVNILNAALETGIRKLVFSSSAATYGEPRYLPIDEKHPTEPENYYGFTKLEIERILAWYDRLKGLRYAALRYFNAAGYDPQGRVRGLEKNPANLIPVIMEVAAGMRPDFQVFGTDYPTPDGTGVRDYLHVEDLASAHLRALDYLRAAGSSVTLNVGYGHGYSVREVLRMVEAVAGQPLVIREEARRAGDPAYLVARAERIRTELGWQPRYDDLEAIVSSSLAWERKLRREPWV